VHKWLWEDFPRPFLIFMEGMTGAQAAKVLKVPQGTVSSRIHKARKILQEKWEEANRE